MFRHLFWVSERGCNVNRLDRPNKKKFQSFEQKQKKKKLPEKSKNCVANKQNGGFPVSILQFGGNMQ